MRKGGQLFSNNFENKIANAAKGAYDGSATVGRIAAVFGLIIGILIAIGLLVGGFYVLRTTNKYTASVSGRVLESNCSPNIANGCDVNVQYYVGGKPYTKTFNVDRNVVKDQSILVAYDPQNPSDAMLNGAGGAKVIGWVMIGFGLLVLLGCIMSFIIAWTTKIGAAATGARALSNIMFRG